MKLGSSNLPRDHYDRPNMRWVCGRTSEGCPCAEGPTQRGTCHTTSMCTPAKEGDTWRCTRSTSIGGACDEGPYPDGTCCQSVSPCRPRRSIRSRRRLFVSGCTLFVIGVLMISTSGKRKNEFFSAGPLSSPHARLVSTDGCIACHESSHLGVSGWMAELVGIDAGVDARNVSHAHTGANQSDRCLSCHQDMFHSSLTMTAHNVDPQWLASRTNEKGEPEFHVGDLFGSSARLTSNIACATCHREHQGAGHDLSAMTNKQCQTCHVDSFDSLERGHPDFGEWPFRRRTKIAFNHQTHESIHFASKAQEFNCNRCHQDDPTQSVKELVGFDQACASCHSPSIQESFASGIPLLTLPMIDSVAFSEMGIDIGPWPAEADGLFDGVIPPMMQLLLASDSQAARAMQVLGPEIDFSLIDDQDRTQVEAAATLARSIRSLMVELRESGNEGIRTRLSVSLEREVDKAELNTMISRTPTSVLVAVADTWFPGGAQGTTNTVSYVPTIEQAREQTRQRLGVTEATSDSTSSLVEAGESSPFRQIGFGQQDQSVWLAENPVAGMFDRVDQPPEQVDPNPPQQVDPVTPQIEPQDANRESNTEPPTITPTVTEQIKFLPSGDWQYDETRMSLAYYPDGHADEILREWIDCLVHTPTERRSDVTQQVIESMISDMAPGRCASCHTIDQQENLPVTDQPITRTVANWVRQTSPSSQSVEPVNDSDWTINWRASRRDPNVRSFTRFSHRPHMIQPTLADCTTCHKIDRTGAATSQVTSFDPYDFRCDFLPINKATCSSCHQPDAASDRCTTCHNYHVQSQFAGSTW